MAGTHKNTVITLRVTPAVHRALTAGAQTDRRSISQYCLISIVEGLVAAGLLSTREADAALTRAPGSGRRAAGAGGERTTKGAKKGSPRRRGPR